MRRLVLFILKAIYNRVAGKLFNGNTYYWGKGSCCALILLAVIMVGCLPDGYEIRKSSSVFVDAIYDSCEYVISNATSLMAHKGNCKYCAERDSIKWEKRKAELIKELRYEERD